MKKGKRTGIAQNICMQFGNNQFDCNQNEFQGQMTLNPTQSIQHLPITNENCSKGINIKQNCKLYLNIQGENLFFLSL